MPRRVTRTRRPSDRWAGVRDLRLATLLLGPLPGAKRADLAGLNPVERDRLLDAEAAADKAQDRYLAWCLGVLDEVDGGPATRDEVERWTKRRRKAEKKARKVAKCQVVEATTEPDPLDPVIPEEPAPRAPIIPPPTPARPLEAAYWDDDD